MERYRSIPVLSLAIVSLLIVLSACSGSPAPAATAAAPPPTAAPAPAAPAAPTAAAPAAPPAAAPTAAAPAKVTEYNVTVFTDLSGPAAESVKAQDIGRKVMFGWWNETRGKELGVKLNPKFYDTHYDPSVVASLWPGALNEKPIFVLAVGSGEISAIGQRLPTDKVPMYFGGGGYGAAWKPDQWVFSAQTTYTHHLAGFLTWKVSTWQESRPLRVGQMVVDTTPSVYEAFTGMQNLANKNYFAGKVEYVGAEHTTNTATDQSNEVKRLVDKKADVIQVLIVPAGVAAAKRAINAYKSDAKMILASSSGLFQAAKGVGSLKDLEGDFQHGNYATEADTEIEAFNIYQQFVGKLGLGAPDWNSGLIQGMVNALFPLRALERAAKATGADKLTGQAVYDAMYSAPFTSKEMLGLTGDLTITKDAAFPVKGVQVRIAVAKDGKIQLASPNWVPVRDIEKW